jgi:hypothetical protein
MLILHPSFVTDPLTDGLNVVAKEKSPSEQHASRDGNNSVFQEADHSMYRGMELWYCSNEVDRWKFEEGF